MTRSARVTTDTLNVRRDPSTANTPVGQVHRGDILTVEADNNLPPRFVRTSSPVAGYVYSQYFDILPVETPFPSGTSMRVITDILNVRDGPGTNHKKIGELTSGTIVQVDVSSISGTWIRLTGTEQKWVSRTYLEAVGTTQPLPPPSRGKKQWGINIDPRNPAANPSTDALGNLGWVRFVFIVGLDTLFQAFARYDPIIRAFNAKGINVLLVLLQDTYWGNGPWDNGGWPAYTQGFSSVAATIAGHYKGQVTAYEIWNEMDIQGQPTSIYIPPEQYGPLLFNASKAIKQSDPSAKVVSGGLAGANPLTYMTKVKLVLGTLSCIDAIGYHPYGQAPPNTNVFGWPRVLSSSIQTLYNTFGVPVWITELGVARVDVNDQSLWPVIATYMRNTYLLIRNVLNNVAPVLIWFAWADSQDRAGIVHDNQQHKVVIFDTFVHNREDDVNPSPAGPVEVPSQPIIEKPHTSLIGVYFIGEDMHGWLDTVSELEANGTPMHFAMVMRQRDPEGKEITPTKLRQRSPKMVIGERQYWEPPGIDWTKPNLEAEGREHIQLYVKTFEKWIDHEADYHLTINEPMPGPGTASFWKGAMPEAVKYGLRLFIFNFPETWAALPNDLDEHGQPKYFREFWTLTGVHETIAQCMEGGHALSDHTYIYPDPQGSWLKGYSMGREDEVIALLPSAIQQVKWYKTEYGTGWSQWFNSDAFVLGVETGDTWLHITKANVDGAALWVGSNWIDNAHPQYSSDIAFHKEKLVPYWKIKRF